jgi:hypothetical protein
MFDSSLACLHGLCFWLPVPVRMLVGPGCRRGLSVLARVVSRRAPGSWTTPGLPGTRVCVPASVAFPLEAHGRRPKCAFRSSIPGPSMPLSTLHPAPRGARRKTRGQDGSLLLSCRALSSPTTRRFIPTLALPRGRGSVITHEEPVPTRARQQAVFSVFQQVYRAATARKRKRRDKPACSRG